jgi:WD40 repeat protein
MGRVWSRLRLTVDGEKLFVLRGHEGELLNAIFNPDGTRVLTTSSDKTARIWDAVSGRELAVLRGHQDRLVSAVFSPDGTRVLTTSDKTARIWDTASGRQLTALRRDQDRVLSAAFASNSARALTTSDNTVRVWDIMSGRELAVLNGHQGTVISADLSPDGTLVITASEDKTVRLWDHARQLTLAVFREPNLEWGSASIFSPDGTRVLTVARKLLDETSRIWRVLTFLTTQALVDDAKAVVPSCLTDAERERAYLDPTPPIWCIEMNKPPYDTQVWKDWLKYERTNFSPPLPDTQGRHEFSSAQKGF